MFSEGPIGGTTFDHYFDHDIATRRLQILIEQYMEARKRRHDFVSTAKAEVAIRAIMPHCPLAGRALDDRIAACAAELGLAVLFDRQVSLDGHVETDRPIV